MEFENSSPPSHKLVVGQNYTKSFCGSFARRKEIKGV
jgi:hypothetical protein